MKIIVCVKQVVDSEATIHLAQDTISWGDSPFILNPFDEYAVEAGLQLKDIHNAEVIALGIGKPGETDALRRALAMGADSAMQITVEDPSKMDTLSAARLVSAAIEKIGDVQLVLFGRQSLDSGSGIVAAQTARTLGWPLLGYIGKIDLEGDSIMAERFLEEKKLTIKSHMPAAISVVQSIGEPRYPSFIGIKRAQKAEIQGMPAAELGNYPDGSRLLHDSFALPLKKTTTCEFITGDSSSELAEKTVQKMMERKIL